eukprot:3882763-Amphidinium_carterae.1
MVTAALACCIACALCLRNDMITMSKTVCASDNTKQECGRAVDVVQPSYGGMEDANKQRLQ